MIINTGGRTDTVQYYSEWLLNRFKEGFVYVRNPLFEEKVSRYELDPKKVDCVVFCSKNYEPILDRLNEITGRFNTYFFYTITAYGKDIEPGVPGIDKSIDTLLKLEKLVGKEKISIFNLSCIADKKIHNPATSYNLCPYGSPPLSPYKSVYFFFCGILS